jgi:hypothetical protein
MKTERIAEIEARVAKATEGPWCYEAHGDTGTYGIGLILNEADVPIIGENTDGELGVAEVIAAEVNSRIDAAFIAQARQDIPDLIAALKEARAELNVLRKGLEALSTTFYRDDQHQAYARHVLDSASERTND